MAQPILKSRRFREEREAEWRRLDRLLRKAERDGAAALDDGQLLSIPVLYRSTLSSLSVARATSLDQELVGYLESLCARAYFFVYGPRVSALTRLRRFFASDWPAAVQALWRETTAAWLLTLIGAFTGFVLVSADSDWFFALLPAGMAAGRDPGADTAFLRQTLYQVQTHGLPVFATFLFTHNAQIALMAFALGFAFCVPSALLLIYNGCMVGALFAVFAPRGLGEGLGGWLFIHGSTELYAVTLAGAAGFHLGWTTAFPGAKGRMEALAEAGRRAAVVMLGVVVMLFVAGILEGVGRQLIRADLARYLIAGGMFIAWSAYFYWPRQEARHGPG